MGFISEEVRRHRTRRAEAFPPSLSRASSHEIIDYRTTAAETPPFPWGSTTLICSPSMLRAMVPASPTVVRATPLIIPHIPLHPQLGNVTVMTPIPQSPISGHHSRSRSTATTDGNDTKDDYFSTRLRQNPGPVSPEDLSPSSKTEPATPITPSGLIGRLRNFGRTKRPVSEAHSTLPTPVAETPLLEDVIYLSTWINSVSS